MALIIPPGFAQCVGTWRLAGDSEPIVCTWGVDVSDAAGDFQLAANAIFDAWTDPDIKARLSNAYTMESITLYVGQDGAPPLAFMSTQAPEVGAQASAPLPQNTSYLVAKRTASAGRRNKGRMFWPSPFENEVDPTGVIGAPQVGFIQTALTDFLAQLTTPADPSSPSTPMVILHTDGGLSPAGPPTVVTALVVSNRVATQRQRLRR